MTRSSDGRLEFSINESVWLKDDAPAQEILSMALEPDITIEENRSDVTIRGALRLTGEYKPSNSDKSYPKGASVPFRTIEDVTETDTGTALLEHNFPIDITIPANRVPDLEELFVIIESFDYELTGERHIQLQADLAITGLSTGQRESDEEARASEAIGTEAEPFEETPDDSPDVQTAAPQQEWRDADAPETASSETVSEQAEREETAEHETAEHETAEETAVRASTSGARSVSTGGNDPTDRDELSEKKNAPFLPSEQMRTENKQDDRHRLEDRPDAETEPEDGTLDDDHDELTAEFLYEAIRKPDQDETLPDSPQIAFKRMEARPGTRPVAFVGQDQETRKADIQEYTESDVSGATADLKRAVDLKRGVDLEKAEDGPAERSEHRPARPATASDASDKSESDRRPPKRSETVREASDAADAKRASKAAPVVSDLNASHALPAGTGQVNPAEREEADAPEADQSAEQASSTYLTKVLAGEEEEQRTRMKICIVQNGESLETISERYQVPVTSLLRNNRLASGSVEPGQVLYISKTSGDEASS